VPVERDPLEIAARALRTRDRSRRDLDERLAQAGIDEAERAEALETLERVGYLDEGRFAEARAATLAARGRGDEAIRHALAREGLSPEAADEALAGVEPERERAVELASGARNPAELQRLLVRMGRNGFSEDSLEAAMAAFAEGGRGA